MPISHRYASCHAPRLCGPFIVRLLQQIMAIAMPTKCVRSRYKSTDFDAVYLFGAVPYAQRVSCPGCQLYRCCGRTTRHLTVGVSCRDGSSIFSVCVSSEFLRDGREGRRPMA